MGLKHLWVEKYAQMTLEDIVLSDDIKKSIKAFLKSKNMINLILSGPPGVGKTLLTRIIIKELNAKFLFMNASDERKIDVMRDKVKNFCSVPSLAGQQKIVALDEGEAITFDAQNALKGIMDMAVRTRFIITTNTPGMIIDALQSRCKHIKLSAMDPKEAVKTLLTILKKEKIPFDKPEVEFVYQTYQNFYPDLRKTINFIQFNSSSGKIDLSAKVEDSDMKQKILSLMKKKDLKSIRKICLGSHFPNTTEVLKFLFEKAPDYVKNNDGTAELIVADGLYKEAFVNDKEINLASTIIKLFEVV